MQVYHESGGEIRARLNYSDLGQDQESQDGKRYPTSGFMCLKIQVARPAVADSRIRFVLRCDGVFYTPIRRAGGPR